MKILYTHRGRKGKDGWGRSFYLAKSMAKLGHDVVFITTKEKCTFFSVKSETLNNVKVLSFPDFIPVKLKSSGFGLISLIGKLFYASSHKFDIVISDLGHRPNALPCKINRKIYNSKYIVEWWDYLGKGGYYDSKPLLFKLLYGRFETKGEIKDKINADRVIVLSEEMKNKCLDIQIKNIKVVHGGCLTDEIKPYPVVFDPVRKLNLCYIGMGDSEIKILEPFLKSIACDDIRKNVRFITFGNKISSKYIEKYNLKGVIEERGWINYSKDSDKLNDIDIYILIRENNLSSRVGWPNKLGDYLASGKPIIITLYGDLIKFVHNNPNGFIPIDYDSESITNAIKDILSNKYDFKLMGLSNRKVAEENTWENKATQILDF